MRVRYVGQNINWDGLFDGNVYEVLEVDSLSGLLRIVDESGEDYLYHPKIPHNLSKPSIRGRFEIVEDDENGTLDKAINH